MTTLLKAYLLGVNDPFQLTKIFVDELRKELSIPQQQALRAGEEVDIGREFGMKSWDADKKAITDSITNLEELIEEEKGLIEDRAEQIKSYEKSRKSASGQRKARITRYLTKYKKFVAQQDKDARTNIKRFQKYIREDKKELQSLGKLYQEMMGFAEGEFEAQDNETKLKLYKKALKHLSDSIEEQRQALQPEGKEALRAELADFNEQASALEIVSEAEKVKVRKKITAKHRKGETQNLLTRQKISNLQDKYNSTLELIAQIESPGAKTAVKTKTQIEQELLELDKKHQKRAQFLAWELVGMTKPEFDDKYDELVESLDSPRYEPREIVAMTQLITGYANPFRNISRNWDGMYVRDTKGQLYVYDKEKKHTDGQLGAYVESPDPPLKVQEKRSKLLEEKKKIWLEGGYPSWGKFVASATETGGKSYVKGLNDYLQVGNKSPVESIAGVKIKVPRGKQEPIPITDEIKEAYKNNSMSLEEFKTFLIDKYPRILSTTEDGKTIAQVVSGNWAQFEEYRTGLAKVLRTKEDKYGQELLDRFDEFFESLTEQELKYFEKPVAESGTTSHGLVRAKDGRVETKKRRLKNLKSLYVVLTSAVSDLELQPSQLTNLRYIINRVKEHMQDLIATKEEDDSEEEDLTEEHRRQLEFWHDVYDEALNIREYLPPTEDYAGDEYKTYHREQVAELLKEVSDLLSKLDTDKDPKEEDYFDLMVTFEGLHRNMEELEIPSWTPKRKEIEKAIGKIEAKLEKFYGKLSNEDLKKFKDLMKEMGILDDKKGKAPRLGRKRKKYKTFSTERKKIIRLYVDALERIRKRLYYKYITDIEMERGISQRVRENNNNKIRIILDFYFPKFTVLPKSDTDRKKPLSQKDVDSHRRRLIDAVWQQRKISLNDYPHLYDTRTNVAGHEVKTHSKKKITEDEGAEDMYGPLDEQLVGEVQQLINDDDDEIIDDDDMGDFAELAESEQDLSEALGDKEGQPLTMEEMQNLLQEREDKRVEEAKEKDESGEKDEKDESITADIQKPVPDTSNRIELPEQRRRDMERLLEDDRRIREEEE